jgi:hypothetical protein
MIGMIEMKSHPSAKPGRSPMKIDLSAPAAAASLAVTILSFTNVAAAGPFINTAGIKNAAPPIVETVRWGGWGWSVGGGLLAGAVIGGALAAPYYRDPYYGYGYPYYGYGYGYPYYYGYGYPRYRVRYYRPWGWRRW